MDLQQLNGDLEHVIDTCFKNKSNLVRNNIKCSVAVADAEDRGGLKRLKYYLHKHGANYTAVAHVMQSLEADQEHYDNLTSQIRHMRYIQTRGQTYRVRLTVAEGHVVVRNFRSKLEAIAFRDKLECLKADLNLEQKLLEQDRLGSVKVNG